MKFGYLECMCSLMLNLCWIIAYFRLPIPGNYVKFQKFKYLSEHTGPNTVFSLQSDVMTVYTWRVNGFQKLQNKCQKK